MLNAKAKEIIGKFNLQSHPEGGYYAETYRSHGVILKDALPKKFEGERAYSTAIYFMLPEGSKSSFHRIKSDEIWHFYLGGPITIVEINKAGEMKKTILGSDISSNELLQYVVPAGVWFGAYPNPGTEFAFVGCTVAPGFDFNDFEMGSREMLLEKFPNAKEEIELLT